MVGFQEIILHPGQFVFGRKKAASEIPLSEQEIRTCVRILVRMKNLTIKSTNKFSIITIINWVTYQNENIKTNQQTNQQLTSNQPATNQQLTTNKNVKNVKNVKNKRYDPSGSFALSPKKTGSDLVENPPVISIPLVCKKDGPSIEYPITQNMIDDWAESYPAVNIIQALRNIRQWNLSNPSRRKTKTGILNHITTWLSKEQNNGEGKLRSFKPIVSTGDRSLDASLTNAANFVSRRMEITKNGK